MKEFYLTKKGLEKIKKEYRKLKEIIRNRVKEEHPGVFQSDEMNPEYQSFQDELEPKRARLVELEHVIAKAKEIEPPCLKERNKVRLGATVLFEVDGQTDELTILESLEADPSRGRISNESPVGKALLGKKVGDAVTVSAFPKIKYKIRKIKYSGL